MKRLLPAASLVIAFVAACSPAASSTTPSQTAAVPAGPTATPTPAPTPAWRPRPSAELGWTFKTGGPVWGSAAIERGTVYFGSDDGKLYALDARSGAQKWEFATQGPVRTTPALTAGSVVFGSDDGHVYAVDTSGKLVWRTDIHSNLKRPGLADTSIAQTYEFDFLASSPVVSGNRVFVGSSDGAIYALDAKTGAQIWRTATGDRVRATPAVTDGTVYVGSWDGYLYALKADTGEQVWRYDAADRILTPKYLVQPIQSTAVVRDGVVYCASRKAMTFAVDAKTGAERWQATNGSGNWLESSPVVSDGMVYIGSSASVSLNAFYADRGVGYSYTLGSFAWSTPLPVGGVVFIGGEGFVGQGNADAAGMYAIDAPSGLPTGQRWFFPVKETSEPAGVNGVNSTPVLADGLLYFGGLDGTLYALGV